LIAINMKPEGQLSRIQNTFLTPVSHPKLPFKAAPGQLSAAEIRTGLALHGVIKPKRFYLFGKPISQSRSPALHNALFKSTGLPHSYELFEADDASLLRDVLPSPDFGGASVTIPLKLDVVPYLDSVSSDAKIIGAVNTIVVDTARSDSNGKGQHLIGQNTDWQGMKLVLENAGAQGGHGQNALVIGGGGTARAAIVTLHAMGYSPVYLLGRSPQKLQDLVHSFPNDYNLKILTSREDAKTHIRNPPSVAIGTIPADKAIDNTVHEALQYILHMGTPDEANGDGSPEATKVLLEMAYKPSVTPLMQLAQRAGWKTVPGLEVLAGQGMYQFEAWMGITPSFEQAKVGQTFISSPCSRMDLFDLWDDPPTLCGDD